MPEPVAFKAVFNFFLAWFSPIYHLCTLFYDNYGLYELDDVKIHQIPMDFWVNFDLQCESIDWKFALISNDYINFMFSNLIFIEIDCIFFLD